MNKPLLVGITGPSGSGKSSLTRSLLQQKTTTATTTARNQEKEGEEIRFRVVQVVGEDPETYRSGAMASSYRVRSPNTERPANVKWEQVQHQISKALTKGTEEETNKSFVMNHNHGDPLRCNVILFEHFLLPFLPRVEEQLDLLIVLDSCDTVAAAAAAATAATKTTTSNEKRKDKDKTIIGHQQCNYYCQRRIQRNKNRSKDEANALYEYYSSVVWPIYMNETLPAIQRLLKQIGPNRSITIDSIGNNSEEVSQLAVAFLQQHMDNL